MMSTLSFVEICNSVILGRHQQLFPNDACVSTWKYLMTITRVKIASNPYQIQLQQEVRVLEKSRAQLEKVVLEAVSHLRVLHDAKQRLQDDIKDKVWDQSMDPFACCSVTDGYVVRL